MTARKAQPVAYAPKMRHRIEGSEALTKLLDFIAAPADEAPKVMTPIQVNAALALLKKVVPDLSQQTLNVEDNTTTRARNLTRQQIEDRLALGQQNQIQVEQSDTQH
jgi:hypothetical protein